MRRLVHAACGYSEFAPGCDDECCLLHRIDHAALRGWDATLLQQRLDAVVADAACLLLVPREGMARTDSRT